MQHSAQHLSRQRNFHHPTKFLYVLSQSVSSFTLTKKHLLSSFFTPQINCAYSRTSVKCNPTVSTILCKISFTQPVFQSFMLRVSVVGSFLLRSGIPSLSISQFISPILPVMDIVLFPLWGNQVGKASMSMLKTVPGLKFYPTFRIANQPSTFSWMLAEDTRHLSQTQGFIAYSNYGSQSINICTSSQSLISTG